MNGTHSSHARYSTVFRAVFLRHTSILSYPFDDGWFGRRERVVDRQESLLF